jgi:sulfonate transport system substrate-binding protein
VKTGYRFLVAISLLLAACGQRTKTLDTTVLPAIRVGYFPNITHSQALIGLSRGDFQKALGPNVSIRTTVFNAGPSAIEALFAREIDLAYVGPNPAINGYVQSRGKALRIIAGAASGGAALVLNPKSRIRSAKDLAGKRLASPQLGNTQDVALRNYVISQGLKLAEAGGRVSIVPTPNPQILDFFRRGDFDGAWVPEPWASRLILEGGGTLFLDERSLWPNGDFVTAHVIVATEFLDRQPELVRAWLRAHVEITRWELEHPDETRALIDEALGKLTGKKLGDAILAPAWSRLRPTWDPIATSLHRAAESAYAAGFLRARPDLREIYDLRPLNAVLREMQLPELQ